MRFFRRGPKDDTGEKMRGVAQLFVETAGRYGSTFDYAEETVPLLDDWADRLWDPAGPRPGEAELDSNSRLMGAYLGEVIIRHLGGQWALLSHDGMQQPVVRLSGGQQAWVLNKAYKRQVNGRSDSFEAFYAGARQLATPDRR